MSSRIRYVVVGALMARNTSFTLSDRFINEQVASGRCGSASEVVREGLRLVEGQPGELEWFCANIWVGLDDIREGRIQHELDELWGEIEQRARHRVKSVRPGDGRGLSWSAQTHLLGRRS